MATNLSKTTSLIIVLVVYIFSIGIAWLILGMELNMHPLVQMLVADVVATILVFGASLVFNNSSMYDPYWSVFPIFAAFYWLGEFGAQGDELRNIILVGLISLWGIRLTLNWARGWEGMGYQDWRYVKLQKDNGKLYWLVSFSGVHMFPTLIVFLGLVPVYYILQTPSPFGLLDVIASFVVLAAIVIETVSDEQLKKFLKSGGGVMKTGVWSWSRHPNYFGEILFWVGLFMFISEPFSSANYWKISGVVVMILLFNGISIPMMEKRQIKKDGYDDYKKRVSRLIPLPPTKK